MNIRVGANGAGIFSKLYLSLHAILVNVRVDVMPKVDRIGFYIDHDLIPIHWRDVTPMFEGGVNPFDLVFDQDNIDFDVELKAGGVEGDLYCEKHWGRLRDICSRIKIHEDVIKRVPPEINERTLGVHIRLTDMNTGHGHGVFSFGDFIKAIEEVRGEYDNIFVACDNDESLQKIPWPVISNAVIRYPYETADTEFLTDYYYKEIGHPRIWHDSFLEMICLSRCGGMIYRTSSLNWAAMCFGSPDMKLYPLQNLQSE